MKRSLLGLGCAALAVMLHAPSVAAPLEPAAAPGAPELIVGSSRGLEAWRSDGSSKRLISRGPARHPRWLDERTVLVLRPEVEGDLARGARLERIAVDSGKRTKVATLPPFSLATEPDSGAGTQWSLDVQAPRDFVVDASRRFACLTLMDRNINMLSATLFVRIDLGTGRISRWFALLDPADSRGALPDGVKAGEPGPAGKCSSRQLANAPNAPAQALPFRFDNERIFEEKDGRRVARSQLAGYSVEESSASPSQRWLYLAGDLEENDYIYRRLVLLDRVTGELFPIRPKGGTWPAPLAPAGNKTLPRYATPVKNTVNVVGESDVRWFGHAPDAEILIIDGLVVRPGAVSFDVRGEIAS